jgi:hypothetical protein
MITRNAQGNRYYCPCFIILVSNMPAYHPTLCSFPSLPLDNSPHFCFECKAQLFTKYLLTPYNQPFITDSTMYYLISVPYGSIYHLYLIPVPCGLLCHVLLIYGLLYHKLLISIPPLLVPSAMYYLITIPCNPLYHINLFACVAFYFSPLQSTLSYII